MKVLVVGSGGREHALVAALAASPGCSGVIAAPGNPGIAALARCHPVASDDLDGLVALARAEAVGLVVVGPEAPLVAGLVDRLEAAGIPALGPRAAAARLEGSKAFMKAVAARAGVPTAACGVFSDPAAARAFAAGRPLPLVVKADGLAAGKGVTICTTRAELATALDEALVARRFGAAGAAVVVEEFLAGEEVSLFALCDGTHAVPFGSAQDHKRVGAGDTGPNTGGMGAYAPAPVLTPALEAEALETIIRPTLAALAAAGTPFRGILFAGLMLVPGPDGALAPWLLEFNVRFGDPEAQTVLARLACDPLPLFLAAATGRLGEQPLPVWHDHAALTVVMAAAGYPGEPRRGDPIGGLEAAAAVEGVRLFHAGTARDVAGRIVSAGGRVLNLTATAPELRQARERAYAAVARLDWPQGFCRPDIGWRALGA